MYKKGLKLLQGVLHRVQKGYEVTSRGFVSCAKGLMNNVKMVLFMEQFGLEVTSSRFCIMYNLGLKLLQVDFASCTIWP